MTKIDKKITSYKVLTPETAQKPNSGAEKPHEAVALTLPWTKPTRPDQLSGVTVKIPALGETQSVGQIQNAIQHKLGMH